MHVQLTHDVKTGLPNAYVGLVFVTFCVGSYLFTLGCFLMTVPVINEASSHSFLCCIASDPAAELRMFRLTKCVSKTTAIYGEYPLTVKVCKAGLP